MDTQNLRLVNGSGSPNRASASLSLAYAPVYDASLQPKRIEPSAGQEWRMI